LKFRRGGATAGHHVGRRLGAFPIRGERRKLVVVFRMKKVEEIKSGMGVDCLERE
jgi:hypothetical protein